MVATHGMASAHVAQAKRRRRASNLSKQLRQDQELLDDWFRRFDTNQNNLLERAELKALLEFLKPDEPPTDEALDYLMDRAHKVDTTGDGEADTLGITRAACKSVVAKHSAWALASRKEKEQLDACFKLFDTNMSGFLEKEQLRALLKAVEASKEPHLRVEIHDEDVDFVLKEADVSATGSIARDECLPAIEMWARLAHTKYQDAVAVSSSSSRCRCTVS